MGGTAGGDEPLGRPLPALRGRRGESSRLVQDILVALAAGIYEEFVFRLALITLAMALFVDLLALPKEAVAASP